MNGLATRLLPYSLAFFSSLCIMILELVASRLVARHVGSSLIVWNSVIGIMLGGICLGNVLGGRLADRVDPRRRGRPALCPRRGPDARLPLAELPRRADPRRALASPGSGRSARGDPRLPRPRHVARDDRAGGRQDGGRAVAEYRQRRSATSTPSGAVGSIVGTFLAGFVLLYLSAPISVVVTVVAAALAILICRLLMSDRAGRVLAHRLLG